MTKIYEVYICRLDSDILYIGQGLKGRHKHCNSGCSHVYELNSLHFKHGTDALDVCVIKEFNDRNLALKLEKELIIKFVPSLNKVMMPNNKTISSMSKGKEVRAVMDSYIDKYEGLSEKTLNKYKKLLNEFIGYYGYASVLNKEIPLYSKQHYRDLKLNVLNNFATHIRHPRKNTKNNMSAHGILDSCLIECFGTDLSKNQVSKVPTKLFGLNNKGEK